MMNKGVSSVMVAVIMAIAIILIIAVIAISMPLARSYADKAHWASEMGSYKPPNPISITNGQPVLNGYCLVNTVNGITYVSCPSTTNSTATP